MVQEWPSKSFWAEYNGTCDENNITQRATCFGRGSCIENNVADYFTCRCDRFYDPLTFCNTTIFDTLQGRDLVYPIVRRSGGYPRTPRDRKFVLRFLASFEPAGSFIYVYIL